MLKQVTSFILIFSLMCSCFSMVLVRTGFELNKKFIAEKLCENRGRPWMHCNGKCFLAKKVREAEQKEAKETYKAAPYVAVLVKCLSLSFFFNVYQKRDFPLDDFNSVSSYLTEIFHPPTVLA